MALCVKVERKLAETVRARLLETGLLDSSYVPAHDEEFVYFAVRKRAAGLAFAEKKLQKRGEPGKPLGEELKGKLAPAELERLVRSFDILGGIAVIEIPPSLAKKQKLIANAIMKNHHNIRTVAKKMGGTAGEFRIRPVRVIAGAKGTHTVYREGGCDFELDINKTYFSSRLGTERARIAALVKPDERVLVPFAGVGPFAIRIAKKEPSADVAGIELNPNAAKYFRSNISRNKCANVLAIRGDVSKILPGKYSGWADRIAMPLPKDGIRFLPHIIPCLKQGGMLHYYSFGNAKRPYYEAEREVQEAAEKLGRKASVIFRRVARPYSKTTVQVVVDARIG